MTQVKFKPGYQDLGAYGMLQPIVNAGGLIVDVEVGDVFNTGIPLNAPPPVLIPSGTRIQYTDGALVGYKLLIYTQLSGSNSYFEYLGTIETTTGGIIPTFLPFKSSGIVNHIYFDGDVESTPFGNAAGVYDDDAGGIVPVEHMGISTNVYGPGVDVFLSAYDDYVPTTFSVSNLWTEYEFLLPEGITPKFTVY